MSMKIKNVKTLITGGSGFLARELIERLLQPGFGVYPQNITCFSRNEGKLLQLEQKYGVELNTPAIKEADGIVLATERRDVATPGPQWERLGTIVPLQNTIVKVLPGVAELEFLRRFEGLASILRSPPPE